MVEKIFLAGDILSVFMLSEKFQTQLFGNFQRFLTYPLFNFGNRVSERQTKQFCHRHPG